MINYCYPRGLQFLQLQEGGGEGGGWAEDLSEERGRVSLHRT